MFACTLTLQVGGGGGHLLFPGSKVASVLWENNNNGQRGHFSPTKDSKQSLMKDCFSNLVKNRYLSVSGGLTDCLYSSFCLHPHSNGETRPPDCNSCFNYWLVVKAKLRLCKRTSGSFSLAKVYLLFSDYLTRLLPQPH